MYESVQILYNYYILLYYNIMSDNDVMPKIDKEIVKRETEKEKVANANENEDEIVLEKEVKPRKQKDIFKDLESSEEEESEIKEPPKVKVKTKKKYPHLEKARAKALITRKKRAEERKIIKEKAREEKRLLKLEKAKARVEKKKEIARNHYWEKKVKEADDKVEPIKRKPKQEEPTMFSGNYNQFSTFMDRYNNDKIQQINANKARRQQQEEAEKKAKQIEKRKQRVSKPMNSRVNIRGMYVNDDDYPNDFFF